MSGESTERLALLMEKHLEGALCEAEAGELSRLLEESEEAFQLYLETSELHGHLERSHWEMPWATAEPRVARFDLFRRSFRAALWAVSACLAIIAGVLVSTQPQTPDLSRKADRATARAPKETVPLPPLVSQDTRAKAVIAQPEEKIPPATLPPEPPPPAPKEITPPEKIEPPTPKAGHEKKPLEELPKPVPPPEKPPAPPKTETTLVVARITRVVGEVFVIKGDQKAPAKAGQDLLLGAGLQTGGPGSRVIVEYPDSTRLEVGPTTVISELPETKTVHLKRGTLQANVPRQPMTFVTPHSKARGVGTMLTLTLTEDETKMEVHQGRVRLTRARDQKTVDLLDGQYAVAGAGVELGAKPLPPIEEIFLRAPEADLVGDDWALIPDPDSLGQALEAARGVPRTPKDLKTTATHAVFTFRADARKNYFLWVRGRCMAEQDRPRSDAVAVEILNAQFNRKSSFMSSVPLDGYLFNGYSLRDGYWWLEGNVGGTDNLCVPDVTDSTPIVVRFTRSGRQTLKLHAVETPLRIDAILLSTTQRSRPDPKK